MKNKRIKHDDEKVCDCEFDSQVAYLVEDKSTLRVDYKRTVTICNYLSDNSAQKKVEDGKLILLCRRGNQLVTVNGNKRTKHFRHKNSAHSLNNGMGRWHKEWQECFDNTEIEIGDRRADAVVGKVVLEFQHSHITQNNIQARTSNYESNGYELYWVIDCNDSINVTETNGKYLIEFVKDRWKCDNFKDGPKYIYLNHKCRLYRIEPKNIQSDMIKVPDCKTELEFVTCVKNGHTEWNITDPERGTIYYNQRGAGCGKTYESIQLLGCDTKFSDKDTFIYLTKMHSAKEVIYNELTEQYKNNKLSNLEQVVENPDKGIKQYKVAYRNKQGDEKKIIIGTIDSFVYAITTKKVPSNDLFVGIVQSIKEGYICKTDGGNVGSDGKIRYARDSNMKLNNKCLIVIDEAQDLLKDYIEAFAEIVKVTGIDVYVVGDKLQSIWGEHNIMTFLENGGLPTEKSHGINCVRRFHEEHFMGFVNGIVDFKKYGLPPIASICDIKNCKYGHNDHKKPVEVYEIPPIYANDTDQKKIDNEIGKIIKYMDREVKGYNYKPNNFMFIFPILTKNTFAVRIESRVQEYWAGKFKDIRYQKKVLCKDEYWRDKLDDKYHPYIYLHKSEEGQSINLAESENATRILSIHSSKGNGCEVVFLLGLTEKALTKFSHCANNLVYDSLLHVSLTRQKKSLYVGVQNNNDDIWNKFKDTCEITSNYEMAPAISDISRHNNCDKITSYIFNNEQMYKEIDGKFIKNSKFFSLLPDNDNNDDKTIIDWGHHKIRFAVFWYNILSNILKNEKICEDTSQFLAMMLNVSKLCIRCYPHNEYYKCLDEISKNNSSQNYQKNVTIPILCLGSDDKSVYHKYKNILYRFIGNIQKKIIEKTLPSLCPMESVILLYMIQTMKDGKYSDITIMDVYNIMYCYDDCSKLIQSIHNDGCICKQVFVDDSDYENQTSHSDVRCSILNHYECTTNIEKMFQNYINYIKNVLKDDSEFVYNVLHKTYYGQNNDKMSIMRQFLIIAHSEKHVIFFVVKPQFNNLNFNKVILDILFDSLIVQNCRDENNAARYDGKKVFACIFTFDSIRPIFVDPSISKDDDMLKNCIKKYLIDKYTGTHKIVFDYYEHCRKNKSSGKTGLEIVCEYLSGDTCCRRMPSYIRIFFDSIKREIDRSRNSNERNSIIKKITDYQTFVCEINKYLEEDVDDFLKIKKEMCDGDF